VLVQTVSTHHVNVDLRCWVGVYRVCVLGKRISLRGCKLVYCRFGIFYAYIYYIGVGIFVNRIYNIL
jgi:hypothetical protein